MACICRNDALLIWFCVQSFSVQYVRGNVLFGATSGPYLVQRPVISWKCRNDSYFILGMVHPRGRAVEGRSCVTRISESQEGMLESMDESVSSLPGGKVPSSSVRLLPTSKASALMPAGAWKSIRHRGLCCK